MTKTGLVSVTFRELLPREIVELCQRAGVDAIEWGGDIHVPHGDLAKAKEVAELTKSGGLEVASYGSYYRVYESVKDGLSFDTVLKTAQTLGAPTIRVWAGAKGSAHADAAYRKAVADDLNDICQKAAAVGIGISLEFHGNTLTDDLNCTLDLLKAVNQPNLKTLWQPSIEMSFDRQKEALLGVLPWLNYFHVFTWTRGDANDIVRHPLKEGAESWQSFFRICKPAYALIEFVDGDKPDQFVDDAQALKAWLK